MTTVTAYIDVPPQDVFAVLADGWYYSGWVVGTSHIRAVESEWPAVGSRLFHVSGAWPAALADVRAPNRSWPFFARARSVTAFAERPPGRWQPSDVADRQSP